MSTALDRVHVVREGHDILVVAVVVLHRDLGDRIALFAAHVDDIGVNHREPSDIVQMLDEALDTSLIAEHDILPRLDALRKSELFGRALVAEDYLDSGVEESLLAKTVENRVVVEHRLLEYRRIGHETHIQTVLAL